MAAMMGSIPGVTTETVDLRSVSLTVHVQGITFDDLGLSLLSLDLRGRGHATMNITKIPRQCQKWDYGPSISKVKGLNNVLLSLLMLQHLQSVLQSPKTGLWELPAHYDYVTR